MVRTEGTEYQTETRSPAIHCASRAGNIAVFSGTTARQAAARQLAKTSKTDRSKLSGAGQAARSRSARPVQATAPSAKVSDARCEIITPLGVPVDPDVYRM